MSDLNRPLIVGAGPVGLGAALFLARQGLFPRVVEMREQPSRESRALAVNPRTLDILEPTGVTRHMLELGLPIHRACLYRGERVIGTLSLAGIHPRYPYMLALSQATTEHLLTRALEEAGSGVERGVKMVGCRTLTDGAEATLEPSAGGPPEIARCPWLLAADGAHSLARQQLGVAFVGSSFRREWYLADVPLRTQLAADQAYVFFRGAGTFLFMLRVVDEAQRDRPGEPVWRVIANRPNPLSLLVLADPAGPPIWESSFHISHRIDETLTSGHVYFAGDAAHVHSPLGARGMNLGLEDAWVFAELVRANRLTDYDRLRRPVDQQVVRQVEFLSRIVSAESGYSRFVREYVFPTAIKVPFLRSRMVKTLTGLDHELPQIAADGTSRAVPPVAIPVQHQGAGR